MSVFSFLAGIAVAALSGPVTYLGILWFAPHLVVHTHASHRAEDREVTS